jgi:aspartate racemase
MDGKAQDMVWRTIGIIGGTGPMATARMHSEVIAEVGRRGAVSDTDYPPIAVVNAPVPGVGVDGADQLGLGREQYQRAVGTLEHFGAEVVAVACVSHHTYIGELARPESMQLVSLVDEVVCAALEFEHVGVLSSATVRRNGLLAGALRNAGVEPVSLGAFEQSQLDRVIGHCMAGHLGVAEVELAELRGKLCDRGAQAIVAGCTELGLLSFERDGVPVLDAMTIAAHRLVDVAGGGC